MANVKSTEFQQTIRLMNFENLLNERLTNVVSFKNGILWRRDSTRLTAYMTEHKIIGCWHYPFQPLSELEELEVTGFDVLEDGTFQFSVKNGEKRIIKPLTEEEISSILDDKDASLEANSLNTLAVKDFELEFKISSSYLSKQLSLLQRKMRTKGIKPEAATLVFNVEAGEYWFEGFEKEKMNFPSEILKKTESPIVSFSFQLFQDLLINASKFDNEIHFLVKQPYYSVIRYNRNTFATLNQKRNKGVFA